MRNGSVPSVLLSPKTRLRAFREIPVNLQGEALLSLSSRAKKDLLRKLRTEEIIQFLHYLDPDKTTDVIQHVSSQRGRALLDQLHTEIREKVDYLLRFDPRTAAGIMSMDYIEVSKSDTFQKVVGIIKKHEQKTGKFPAVLVTHKGFLLGELPGRQLLLKKKTEKVGRHVRRIPALPCDSSERNVMKVFQKNRHNKIAVLDNDQSVMGVIYAVDVIQVLHKNQGRSLSTFAGVREEEDVGDGIGMKVQHRYKWLIINLFTAFLAAGVVGLFQDTIAGLILLAVYMPVVAGMGGNAATQTLAVVVRGMALKEVDLKTGKRVIMREMGAGIVNGVIIGVIVAVIAFLINQNILFGAVVSVAIVINLVIAGFFGSIIPLILQRVGKDPASSATVFITTATDVLGFFAFLWLASLVL